MRTHRNRISVMQRPKPEKPIVGSEATGTLTSSDGSTYRWHQCFRDSGAVKGSGEIEKRRGWECPDCGCPVDCDHSACERCGSVEPAVFVEGT
jgi:hypothetical protein